MTVLPVIVTFNRLALLQECIGSIRKQTYPISSILVINNSSTDGTTEWLQAQPDVQMIVQPNEGGSAGFYRGIKEACALRPEWIWLMDDDTVPMPGALEALLAARDTLKNLGAALGFLSSRVLWTDGSEHNKNRTPFLKGETGPAPGIKPVRSATFVSLLLSRAAVEKVGLPLKDFFIWYDDVEFTWRITRSSLKGFLVEESRVVHKTPDNLNNTIFSDDPKAEWKYFYGTRNHLYLRRQKKGTLIYYSYVLKNFFYVPLLLLARRRDSRWRFIKTVWKGTWAALAFSPRKERLPDQELL